MRFEPLSDFVQSATYNFHPQQVNYNKFSLHFFYVACRLTSIEYSTFCFHSSLAFEMQEPMPSSSIRGRSKTTYYHNGVGGRGNYHKRTEDADSSSPQHQPRFARSLAAFLNRGSSGTASKPHVLTHKGESSNGKGRELRFPLRWFIGIGALGSCGARKHHSPSSDMPAISLTSSEHTSEELPLSAAYVLRSKILGEQPAPKSGED